MLKDKFKKSLIMGLFSQLIITAISFAVYFLLLLPVVTVSSNNETMVTFLNLVYVVLYLYNFIFMISGDEDRFINNDKTFKLQYWFNSFTLSFNIPATLLQFASYGTLNKYYSLVMIGCLIGIVVACYICAKQEYFNENKYLVTFVALTILHIIISLLTTTGFLYTLVGISCSACLLLYIFTKINNYNNECLSTGITQSKELSKNTYFKYRIQHISYALFFCIVTFGS